MYSIIVPVHYHKCILTYVGITCWHESWTVVVREEEIKKNNIITCCELIITYYYIFESDECCS